jgi:cellulose/xylan binding protein with CBM9 domain
VLPFRGRFGILTAEAAVEVHHLRDAVKRKGEAMNARQIGSLGSIRAAIGFAVALTAATLGAAETMTEGGAVSFYDVQRALTPIQVDGSLDELGWQLAPQVNSFERILNDYDEVQHVTRAKLLWDDDALYVGFACTDPDIWAIFADEDDPMWSEEVVEVFIDPNGDGKNYLELEVNPLNAWVDLKIHHAFPQLSASIDWDIEGLQTAVQVSGTVNDSLSRDVGWTVEMAIPWTAMADSIDGGGRPLPGDTWRLNLYRIERTGGRQLKQRIDALIARKTALEAEIQVLLTGADGSQRTKANLGRRERRRLTGLTEQLASIEEELEPWAERHHDATEYTTFSETWRQGFHHPARFGVVRFAE